MAKEWAKTGILQNSQYANLRAAEAASVFRWGGCLCPCGFRLPWDAERAGAEPAFCRRLHLFSIRKVRIMKWTDTQRIAEELYDLHGDSINPATLRFTQLRDLILALPDFDDDPARCGERVLEAVQQAWIKEVE